MKRLTADAAPTIVSVQAQGPYGLIALIVLLNLPRPL
jgi:hypothetical protein